MDLEAFVRMIDSTLALQRSIMKMRPNAHELEPAGAIRDRMVSELQALGDQATKEKVKQLAQEWRKLAPPSRTPSPNPTHHFVQTVCEAVELW